jgi:hypothetical protein
MSWALVTTASHTERSVAKRFLETEIEHLLVKSRKMRIWRGRKIERLVAAFPRYIFVKVNGAWDAIRNVVGVVDFVRIGLTPAEISDEVITNLRSRLDRDGVLPVEEKSRFQFGERVVIRGTRAVSGHEALFQFPLHGGRVCILQEWMGRFVPVEIDEEDLLSLGEYNELRKARKKRRRHRSRRRAVAIKGVHVQSSAAVSASPL